MSKRSVLEIIVGMKDTGVKSKLKGLSGNLKKFSLNVKKAFNSKPVRAFRVAVIALGVALVASVVSAAKFNVQMARTWTMAGGGIKTFKKLREEARKLSSEFGIARASVAKGMYNALSAGIDKANIESFMTTAAKVAVADGSDISVAVDGITTVLNAWGIEATETESVTDKLFQTVKMGKTTFGDLSASLATVAPMAAASKIPLEQILAHVAALTAQGTPTAQAMTQIRASIQGMNKALGDGWSDNMTYQDALKEVWSLAGESQTELLKMVGSTEAVQAVLGGVAENAKTAGEKLEGMKGSAGAAQEAFEKVDQFRHWAGFIETAKNMVTTFGGEIDERLKPFVENITEKLQEWQADDTMWDGLGVILDNAQAKMVALWDIIKQINSVDDLKMVMEVVATYFKGKLLEGGKELAGFLAEKAPIIGDVIGKAILEASTAVFQPGADRRQARQDLGQRGQLEQEFTTGGFLGLKTTPDRDAINRNRALIDERVAGTNQAYLASKGATARESITGSGENGSMTWEDAKAAIKEGLVEGIAAASTEKQAPSENSTALAAIFEKGLSGQDLDAAINGLELTAQEYEKVVEYAEQFSEVSSKAFEAANKVAEEATKTAEAATKSSEAAVESSTKVTAAMDRSKEAALAAAQAADRNIQISDQTLALTSQMAGSLARLEGALSNLQGQVDSMRV